MMYTISAVTDKGKYKRTNQDSAAAVISFSEIGYSAFAIVCDGVGSLARSEIASSYAVKTFSNWYCDQYKYIADMPDEDDFCLKLYEEWQRLFNSINRGIYSYAKEHGIRLATTLSCVLVRNGFYYILHIGDTRVYLLTDKLHKLTTDHTVAENEVAAGRLSPEQALKDKRQHVLTRCIGVKSQVKADFVTGNFSSPAKFLVCCDGFRNRIRSKKLYSKLKGKKYVSRIKLDRRIRNIIRYVRRKKEKDNITAVMIAVSKE